MSTITISILVHRDFGYIHAALESLFRSTKRQCRVVIVVNIGEPGHIEALAAAFNQIEIIVNEQPQGFAANHNHVLRSAHTDYVALLNDDILFHERAFEILIEYLDTHPDVAVVGPKLQNPDGSYQVSVYSDPTLLRMIYKIVGLAILTRQGSWLRRTVMRIGKVPVQSWQVPQTARPVDIVKGAVMIVRTAAYQEVGPMDEVTKAYGEEVDWHLRFRQAGWQVVVVPEAVVTHYGSGQAELRLREWQIIEDRKAILNYFTKHKPVWQAVIIRVVIVTVHALIGSLWWLLRSQRAEPHLQTARMGASWRRPSSYGKPVE